MCYSISVGILVLKFLSARPAPKFCDTPKGKSEIYIFINCGMKSHLIHVIHNFVSFTFSTT